MTRSRTVLLAVFSILFLAFFQFFRSKDTFLLTTNNARWIKQAERELWLAIHISNESPLFFRRDFQLSTVPDHCQLTIRSFRQGTIFLNKREIGKCPNDWKIIDLSGQLQVGQNTITVRVVNKGGPQMLIASSDTIPINTGIDWSVSADKEHWSPAYPADKVQIAEFAKEFPNTQNVNKAYFTFFILWIALFLIFIGLPNAKTRIWYQERNPKASQLAWLVFGIWLVLCGSNMTQLEPTMGCDNSWHISYVTFVWKHKALPLASDGWQYFRPPLFYVLSAVFLSIQKSLLSLFFNDEQALKLAFSGLRLIPIICGALQVHLLYKISKIIFPNNSAPMKLSIIAGTFLPFHIYISQFIGNEPICGLINSWLLYRSIKLVEGSTNCSRFEIFTLGLGSGLGLLTKYTTFIMLFFVALAILFRLTKNQRSNPTKLKTFGFYLLILSTVCGWYFIRNSVLSGTPIPLGRGSDWWQYPGFITPSHLFSATSLDTPVLSASSGVFDGLYSAFWLDTHLSGGLSKEFIPAWNYSFMVSLAIISIPMTLLMIAGFFHGFKGCLSTEMTPRFLIVLAVTVFLSATVWQCLMTPFYCVRKITYTLGILPAYGCLIGMGFELLPNRFRIKSIFSAYIIAWWLIVLMSFFVIQ
jgi:hypothetical protein